MKIFEQIKMFRKVLSEVFCYIISLFSAGQDPTLKQYKNFVFQRIFDEVIRPTVHDEFVNVIWEDKLHNETLKNYMKRVGSFPSNVKYKKAFDQGQLEKIDMNPQCNNFDIS